MTDRATCCVGYRSETDGSEVCTPPSFPPRKTPVEFSWRPIDAGAFRMGSSDTRFPEDGEGPVRAVRLGAFAIAAHTVTNAQFGDFVRETGYATDAERFNWSFLFHAAVSPEIKRRIVNVPRGTPWWYPVPRAYWAQPEGPNSTALDRLDHPVVHVSWNDAKAYCLWSGTRLPTEAEWECAARGGLDQKLYPWGNELMPQGEHRCNIWQGQFPTSNTGDDGYLGTAPVDAYQPNGYGLYNVAGNVWEWCEDFFSPNDHKETAGMEPICKGPSEGRLLRGGSFLCHESYCNRYRVAARSSNTRTSSASNIGFRVAELYPKVVPCAPKSSS